MPSLPIPPQTGDPQDDLYPIPFAEIQNNTDWSGDQLSIPYQECGLAITYSWDQGTLQIPVAAPFGPSLQPAAVLVQLCAPYMQVRVEWEATRVGEPPIAPDPRPPLGSNYVLKGFRFGGKAPELTANGNDYLFSVAGVYEYFLAIPNSPDFGYQLGALPTQTGFFYVYSAAQFRQTIFQLI